MSILGTLLGTDAANAAKAAAADTYAKQRAATGAITGYGDRYADRFRELSGAFDPYVDAGRTAVTAYDQLLRDPLSVRSLPGYQFNLDQGTRALDNSAVARSGVMNGKLIKDQTRFATDYADTQYGNHLQRLMAGTQLGQQATGAQTGLVGTGLQGQMATRQSAYGGDMNSAGTIGQGDIAAANAKTKAMQGLMDFGGKIVGSAFGGGVTNPLASLLGGSAGMVGNPHWYGQRAGVDF